VSRRRLAGGAALLTGASGGIGAALAERLAASGVSLALLARRPGPLEALAARLAPTGMRVTLHPCDVADAAAVEEAVGAARAAHGRLDLVANVAGVGHHGPFETQPAEAVERLLRTNLHGAIHVIRATLPDLEASRGALVNVSSVAGRLGQPDEALYSASKFALTGLSEALAVELAPRGIHVLSVYPGFVRTGFLSPAELERVPESVKRGAIEPEVVADATLRALERGRHEVTVPAYAAGGYVVRTLAPPLFRRILARLRLPVLER
jgi:short-subunit dehydrogenase